MKNKCLSVLITTPESLRYSATATLNNSTKIQTNLYSKKQALAQGGNCNKVKLRNSGDHNRDNTRRREVLLEFKKQHKYLIMKLNGYGSLTSIVQS